VLVNLWLQPHLLFRIKDEDVVHYALLSIAFAAAKHDKILPELG
jgi:hypothetical protein